MQVIVLDDHASESTHQANAETRSVMDEVVGDHYVHGTDPVESNTLGMLLEVAHMVDVVIRDKVMSRPGPRCHCDLAILWIAVPLNWTRNITRCRVVSAKTSLEAAHEDAIGPGLGDLVALNCVTRIVILQPNGVATNCIEEIVSDHAILGVLHVHSLAGVGSLVVRLRRRELR